MAVARGNSVLPFCTAIIAAEVEAATPMAAAEVLQADMDALDPTHTARGPRTKFRRVAGSRELGVLATRDAVLGADLPEPGEACVPNLLLLLRMIGLTCTAHTSLQYPGGFGRGW